MAKQTCNFICESSNGRILYRSKAKGKTNIERCFRKPKPKNLTACRFTTFAGALAACTRINILYNDDFIPKEHIQKPRNIRVK